MKLPELSNRTKNIITYVGLAVIAIPFMIVGVCKAYDTIVLSSLENSLAQNVASITTTKKACDASYAALKAYKEEAKLALVGTGNPCGGF